MTIREAQRLFERMGREAERAAERGFRRVLARGLSLARKQTSGRRSLAELRRMDRPFARRRGSPLLDPSIVNVQSGRLLSRWHATWQVSGASVRDLRGAVINDDPVTIYLEGTRVMFRRPVAAAVEKKLSAEAEALVGNALRGVLSRYAT